MKVGDLLKIIVSMVIFSAFLVSLSVDGVSVGFAPALPNSIKFIKTREDAIQFVQTIYREFRDYMEDGNFNDSNM